jgi:lipopolysaccharide transport system ATP-binding protein
MSKLVVECNKLSKKFRWYERHFSLKRYFANLLKPPEKVWEWYVLKDIDLNIQKGERVGIIGKNGCGKSSLLKLITGIYSPTSGSCQIYAMRKLALIELGVGFYHDLTGRENIRLNWVLNGLPRSELKQNFESIIEFAGIEKFLDTPLKYYSSGMVTRLGFAIASHAQPDLLIVDEVLAVGDAEFQNKCYEKIDQLCSTGVTLILVSHNTNDIKWICDRAIWIDNGVIKFDGNVNKAISNYENAQ